MEDGWIKIYPHRLLGWEWYDDANMFRLFMHLLLKANYKDNQWHGITIKRGQLVTSLVNLSTETGLSLQTVRTCLARLTSTGEINKQVTHKYTLLTVCKYGKYQQGEQDYQHATNTQLTSKQHATNTQLTTTSETKNNRNKDISIKEKINKKEKAEKPPFVDPAFEESFSMWLEYKHQRKESYKSDMSLKACYNKLVKLAGGDPSVAMAIVEQSMANNWAGLFALKNDSSNATADNQPNHDPRTAERMRLAEGYAATIARLAAEDDARAANIRQP